jgi:hypothetical protein
MEKAAINFILYFFIRYRADCRYPDKIVNMKKLLVLFMIFFCWNKLEAQTAYTEVKSSEWISVSTPPAPQVKKSTASNKKKTTAKKTTTRKQETAKAAVPKPKNNTGEPETKPKKDAFEKTNEKVGRFKKG